MKHKVTRFKSLTLALVELNPFVLDGRHLETGRVFKKFADMRSREMLANWLLCVVGNAATGTDRFTFTTDPTGGDGVIYDSAAETGIVTEHVLVSSRSGTDGRDAAALIEEAVRRKLEKGGAAYARGKTLVVFLNAPVGEWWPNQAARQLPETCDFEAVWVVGLQRIDAGDYVYGVTRLDLSRGNAPTWLVWIASDFGGWRVELVQ